MALAAVTRFSSPEPVASVALRADVGQTAGLCIMKWKAMKSLVVGIDLGGTHMGLALVAENGSIRYQRKEKTLAAQGAESISRRLTDACRDLMTSAGQWDHRVQAVGLGAAGRIDLHRGAVVFSPNIPELNGYPLREQLQQQLQVPVILENDADAFGLGENWAGAGRELHNWVGLTLGTGVGGCRILQDRLWEGDGLGCSAEIVHMVVDPQGPLCNCGVHGCLEAHASQSALLHGVEQAIAARVITAGPLLDHWNAGTLDADVLHACARTGEPLAHQLFQRMGWALGLALGNLFKILGIRHAIIGGGVSAAWDSFAGPLHASIKEHCRMISPEEISIQRSPLGDDAAMVGVSRLAWQRCS
jgi:glucokinase